MTRTVCKLCTEPLEPRLSTGGSGRYGEVAVELGAYRVRTCPVGHFRHFPVPEFGGALREEIARLLPVGTVCPGCGAQAAVPTAVRLTERLDVPQGEGPTSPLSVVIDVPAQVCGCGMRWLDERTDSDLSDAVIAAFLGLRP